MRDAVLHELAEVGYGKLTMDGVARRAGSSKPTLYRRWPSKHEMVVDALSTVSLAHVPTDDDPGSLLEHLVELARGVHAWLSDPVVHRVLPDLLAEGIRDPAMDAALTKHVAEPRRGAIRALMATAQDRGDVLSDADLEIAIDLVGALIYWRTCVLRREVDDDYLEHVARIIHRELTMPDAPN